MGKPAVRRISYTGTVDLDEGIDLPEMGSELRVEIVAKVDGDHKDVIGPKKQKSVANTAVTTIQRAEILEVTPPPEPDPELPLDGEGSTE